MKEEITKNFKLIYENKIYDRIVDFNIYENKVYFRNKDNETTTTNINTTLDKIEIIQEQKQK